ncbi:MAG: alkaline phosphatase family protein [Verrucomicrobiota bacterium]
MDRKKILLIGWDGADWEHIHPLLDQGLLPTLESLINRGTIGNLATLQPVLSPMLWNSVATGKFPDKHGIHGFVEPDPASGGARPFSSLSRSSKALWNIFSQSGLRSNVVNWWASHPAEPIHGAIVSNLFNGVQFHPEKGWQISPGVCHPEEKSSQWAPLKFFPSEVTAEHIFPFIPAADQIDQENDKRPGTFAKTFSEMMTTHSVATALMETEPWDFMAIYYTGIDHFSHAFMPYYPPRMPHISEKDFEIYQHVVTGAYRFHDMMLERLLQLAGPDTTVILCSDHGFQSGPGRPLGVPREPAGPAIWHRQYGILVAAGPGIKKDERIHGASLIDIGPTILHLAGLPIGQDMDGRPLIEILSHPEPIQTIPTWETVSGQSGLHPPGSSMPEGQKPEELLEQFIALGYIDKLDDDKEKQARSADIESKYNLARCLLWQQREDEAIPLLEDILHQTPWETRFIIHLADAYQRAGYLTQSENLLTNSFDLDNTPVIQASLLQAKIRLQQQRFQDALTLLKKIASRTPRFPEIPLQIGSLFLKLHQPEHAEESFRSALAINPELAQAHEGLSTACLRQRKIQECADSALAAVGLLHRLPTAHLNLGIALARSGQDQRAQLAFQTAANFAPQNPNPQRWLAFLARRNGDAKQAQQHQAAATQLRNKKTLLHARIHQRQHLTRSLPDIPNESERHHLIKKEHPRPSDIQPSGKTFLIVSGLPRSGTSLMMQLLAAAGKTPVTDNQRTPDQDNPEGYYELEDIKKIAQKPEILDSVPPEDSVLKVISMLLPQLPPQHQYKVIFMMRDLSEVAASQNKMLHHRGEEQKTSQPSELIRGLKTPRDNIIQKCQSAENHQLLLIDYGQLVSSPHSSLQKIADFASLPPSKIPDMLSTIKPSLHRNRS